MNSASSTSYIATDEVLLSIQLDLLHHPHQVLSHKHESG